MCTPDMAAILAETPEAAQQAAGQGGQGGEDGPVGGKIGKVIEGSLQAYQAYEDSKVIATEHEIRRDQLIFAAQDAIDIGQRNENQFRREVDQMRGTDHAVAAASGIDANFGTIEAIDQQNLLFAEQDALIIRDNARRQALGLFLEARAEGVQAEVAEEGGRDEAARTILNTATSVLSDFGL